MCDKNQPMVMHTTPKESHGDPLRRLFFSLPPWHKLVPGGSNPRYRAIIYEVQRLGDFLFAVKAIEKLLSHFGAQNCALAVSPEAMPLAQDVFPSVPKITVPLTLPTGSWNLLAAAFLKRRLAAHSCENLICLRHHRSSLASAVLRWIPANIRWGIVDHPWMSAGAREVEEDLFFHKTPYCFPAENGIPAEVAANAKLLAMVTGERCQAEEFLPEFPVGETGRAKHVPILAIAPWGSSAMKRIPEEMIPEILSGLIAEIAFGVVVLAAPGESARAAALVKFLRAQIEGLDIAHVATPDLEALKKQISSADAVLACDSFSAHLAVAFDRPTAVLIAGATPGLFGPWCRSDRQHWFTKELACYGCGWHCIHSRPLCLTEISPREIVEFLFAQLPKA